MYNATESVQNYNHGKKFKSDWLNTQKVYKHEEAIESYQLAIAKHPQNLLAYRWLAFELRHLNRFSEAQKIIEQGLNAGQWPEELDDLFSVHWTTDEMRQDLWFELGLVHADAGDYEKALIAFSETVSLGEKEGKGPGLVTAKECIAEIQRGTYNPNQHRILISSAQYKINTEKKGGCIVVIALLLSVGLLFLLL